MTGLSDDLYQKMIELCEVLHISPMATEAIIQLFYEAYYEGYDEGLLTKTKSKPK